MDGLDFIDVDYCKYGMPYRKRTRIWNNSTGLWTPRPLCKKIVVLWMGTGIGKQHREHPAIKKIVGQNTIHCLSKGVCIESYWTNIWDIQGYIIIVHLSIYLSIRHCQAPCSGFPHLAGGDSFGWILFFYLLGHFPYHLLRIPLLVEFRYCFICW